MVPVTSEISFTREAFVNELVEGLLTFRESGSGSSSEETIFRFDTLCCLGQVGGGNVKGSAES